MTVSPRRRVKFFVPDVAKALDPAIAVEVLMRHAGNVTTSAAELNVPTPALRRLVWSNPRLMDAAFEIEERRLDKAEAILDAALEADDARRKEAAAVFVIKTHGWARKRAWAGGEVVEPSRRDDTPWTPPMYSKGVTKGKVEPSPVAAEPVAAEPIAAEPSLMPWPGPNSAPPPLVAHLYALAPPPSVEQILGKGVEVSYGPASGDRWAGRRLTRGARR